MDWQASLVSLATPIYGLDTPSILYKPTRTIAQITTKKELPFRPN